MSDNPPERKPRFNFGALTKTKVAGIPVLYILLVVAAIALFMALRMKKSTSDEPAVDEITDAVALPTYENPVFEADTPQGGTTVPSGDGEGDSGVPDAEPGESGEVVVPEEPNESVPIPTPTPTPSPVPPSPSPAPQKPQKQGTPGTWHTIQGASDDGPGDLALLYFGQNNADIVTKIRAQNIERGPGPWAKGTRVWIPPNKPPQYFKATNTVRSAPDIAMKNGVKGGGPEVKALNPGKKFPVAVGTQVRVD